MGEALHPVPRQAPPLTLGSEEIDAFLTDLAVERQVSASTQNQPNNSLQRTPYLGSWVYGFRSNV